MSVSEITQIITAAGVIIAAGASLIGVFKINKVHATFNSKMTEFLKLTAQTSEAKGRRDAEDEAAGK